ncbi:DNA-binding protein [Nanobdella aerobiophila]|uniref:DNA-binding protein n=1 Tax=Nanobdella aerobiophila TaxID=2586965 RepID=A0A915SF92_9ARCH|nr:HEPN domain-containing protein [Nanobdella aerobiophila]BBL45239.1 DNA-binding protein [Nanobdella aerobiophila]
MIDENIIDWLKLADDDLKTAKDIYKLSHYRIACFLSQQSVEKYLKAFLVYKNYFDIYKHRTHDIRILIDECKNIDKSFNSLEKSTGVKMIEELSKYSIKSRYDPKSIENVTEEDAKEAIDIAEKVREFIYKKLNISIDQ